MNPWDGDAVTWDAVVQADPDGTFDHLAGWRDVIQRGLGHRAEYVTATDGHGRVRGVLPLVRVRSRLFGHYLVSMPFLNAGGPLGPFEARQALTEHAVAEARRTGADLLEFRTVGAPPPSLTVSHRKITHVLDLPSDAEALRASFPSKLRSQIRRPAKAGLVARAGPEERGAFYEVFARQMRALGTPVLPREWFERIADAFPREAVFVVVYDGATPVAGGCGSVWRGGCEITWAGARREWSAAAPNMLLYWTFMEEAIRRGAARFDFGRCSPGSATHAFKRQWGGEDIPLTWGQWRRGAVTATPTPTGPFYRAATACWSRLPLGVTNRLGPRLARSIP